MISKCDSKGRVYLREEVREKYGKEFYVLQAPNEIVLLPIPKDPLKSLLREGKKLPRNLSVADLKKRARETALRQAI